jgi:tripartite-type tricarboxylate transporter receptor subunit TctC
MKLHCLLKSIARTALTLAAAAGGLAAGPLAQAEQAYPTRPIRLIIPFAPGGGADYFARPLAQKLTAELGQSVVADNRGGANGAIGAEFVKHANPDGYTLLLGSAGVITIGPAVSKNLQYEPARDFVPVGLVANSPFSLIVNPAIGTKTFADFLAYARANPGKLRYGSSGIGGAPHLAGLLFENVAKVRMDHVPYRGVGPMITDLLANRINLTFIGGNVVQQFVDDGKLLLLATASSKRSPVTPNVPTTEQAGLPGFQVGSWYGVFAPEGTPGEIVARLNRAINKILVEPDMRELLARTGALPEPMTPADYAAFLSAERGKWEQLAKAANITIE